MRLVTFSDGVFAISITLRRHRLLSKALSRAGATAISKRFQLALAWLATGALLGAVLPLLGVALIAAFNTFYWLPIRGESPSA